MRTFGDMIEETLSHLRSFVRDQEMSTHLTADISDTELSLPVEDAAVITRGRIEIGSELLWVDKVERAAGQVSLPPYGRGMDGTKAAYHLAGTRVIVAPLYPRKFLMDSLNQAIRSVGQKLYGVQSIDMALRPGTFTYEIPDYVREVLSIREHSPYGGAGRSEVIWLREWTFDKHAPYQVSSSGKALYLMDGHRCANDIVTLTVSRDPVSLTDEDQLFKETWLPESTSDIPVLLAASRLLATSDAYAIQTRSVEANSLDSKIQPGQAVAQSKYLYQLAGQRIEEERLRLLNSTIQRSHRVR